MKTGAAGTPRAGGGLGKSRQPKPSIARARRFWRMSTNEE